MGIKVVPRIGGGTTSVEEKQKKVWQSLKKKRSKKDIKGIMALSGSNKK